MPQGKIKIEIKSIKKNYYMATSRGKAIWEMYSVYGEWHTKMLLRLLLINKGRTDIRK